MTFAWFQSFSILNSFGLETTLLHFIIVLNLFGIIRKKIFSTFLMLSPFMESSCCIFRLDLVFAYLVNGWLLRIHVFLQKFLFARILIVYETVVIFLFLDVGICFWSKCTRCLFFFNCNLFESCHSLVPFLFCLIHLFYSSQLLIFSLWTERLNTICMLNRFLNEFFVIAVLELFVIRLYIKAFLLQK